MIEASDRATPAVLRVILDEEAREDMFIQAPWTREAYEAFTGDDPSRKAYWSGRIAGGAAIGAVSLTAVAVAVLEAPAVSIGAARAGKAVNAGAKKGSAVEKLTRSSGRAKNHCRYDKNATGAHTAYRKDAQGKVTHYTTWEPNRHAKGQFESVKRFRGVGRDHAEQPPPFVYEAGPGGGSNGSLDIARSPESWELPPGY